MESVLKYTQLVGNILWIIVGTGFLIQWTR